MVARLSLPPAPSSASAARRFVQAALRDLPRPDAPVRTWDDEDLGWTAGLLVSELVTNAVLHARTEVVVTVQPGDGGTVRIEVHDGSARQPRPRTSGQEATTGRGLRLVEDLAARWGVRTDHTGKTVWLELSRDAPAVQAAQPDLAVPLDLEQLAALGDPASVHVQELPVPRPVVDSARG